MVAYYEVRLGIKKPLKRILRVDDVRDEKHARELQQRIANVHADGVRFIRLEEYALHYSVHEVETERNLLGGPRRYSTGTRTVTIPKKE
jgi:hypothetical protein